jgi:DNA-binding MarR family transcriptional regulator
LVLSLSVNTAVSVGWVVWALTGAKKVVPVSRIDKAIACRTSKNDLPETSIVLRLIVALSGWLAALPAILSSKHVQRLHKAYKYSTALLTFIQLIVQLTVYFHIQGQVSQMQTFIDTHEYSESFLGFKLSRLVELIISQGDQVFKAQGLSFPPRAASTVLLISDSESSTTADIARQLQQPHQVATQRVEMLIDLGLIKRTVDPKDARRKKLTLSKRGRDECVLLRKNLKQANSVFDNLYHEIDINLSAAAQRAFDALSQKSLPERFEQEQR